MLKKHNDIQDARYVIPMNPRYHAGLTAFKKRCTDYASIKQFLKETFEGDAQGIRSFLQKRQEARVADVGCGDGTITSYLTGLLLRATRARVALDIIEPLGDYIVKTEEKLRQFTGGNLTTNFIQKKSEDYFAHPTAEPYDLVFASHSLHLIPLSTIANIIASVRSGGYIVVVIGARNSIMSTLKDLFAPRPAITGEDVLRFVQRNFVVRHIEIMAMAQPSFLDLSGIELPERKEYLTEEAKNILSLMLQKNIDDINQEGYARVRQLVLGRPHAKKLRLDNDGFVFRISE